MLHFAVLDTYQRTVDRGLLGRNVDFRRAAQFELNHYGRSSDSSSTEITDSDDERDYKTDHEETPLESAKFCPRAHVVPPKEHRALRNWYRALWVNMDGENHPGGNPEYFRADGAFTSRDVHFGVDGEFVRVEMDVDGRRADITRGTACCF